MYKLLSLFLFFTFSIYATPIQYAPIMVGDIITFVPYKDTTPPLKPILETIIPHNTVDDSITITIKGEIGAQVYVNGKKVAIISNNGIKTITLQLKEGENIFKIYLHDSSGNISTPLIININRIHATNFNLHDVRNITLSKDGTKAYVADREGLEIVDISNFNHPSLLGSFTPSSGYAKNVILSSDGTKAYLSNAYGGLYIIDITDDSNPVFLGKSIFIGDKYDTILSANNVALSKNENRAYVVDDDIGFYILDISDPTHLKGIGLYQKDYGIQDVVVSKDGTKVYLASGHAGLLILDVSNETAPILVGQYTTPESYSEDIVLSSDNKTAYIADNSAGVKIIDVSNPMSPLFIGAYDGKGYTHGIALSQDELKIYTVTNDIGMEIIDITNPATPIIEQTIYMREGSLCDIVLNQVGTKAYISNDYFGMKLIDLDSL